MVKSSRQWKSSVFRVEIISNACLLWFVFKTSETELRYIDSIDLTNTSD